MKILLVTPEFPPNNIGGGGIVYEKLAKEYKRLGHEVIVLHGDFTNSDLASSIEEETLNGIKFYKVPLVPFPKSRPFLRGYMPPVPFSGNKVKKIINKEQPDIAHLHGYGFIIINKVAKILRQSEIPYIFTIHGYPETQNNFGNIVKLIWKVFTKYSINPTLKGAKRITAVSDFIRNDVRNIAKAKSTTVYNGINIKNFKSGIKSIDIRKELNIPKDSFVIYSLGRISKMKGFQEVIKRLPELVKKNKDVYYVIAGEDDGYKSTLMKQVTKLQLAKRVFFTGFHDSPTKKAYIKQSNIFAIPSLWEPFGLVALEGIVFHKIILTTMKGGLKEILSDYPKTINIYNDNIIDKYQTLKDLSTKDFEMQNFNWDNIIQNYLEIMKDAIK